jgi:hypothetical protein
MEKFNDFLDEWIYKHSIPMLIVMVFILVLIFLNPMALN